MKRNLPTDEEQSIAEAYVLDRILPRPDTDFRKVLKYAGLYLLIVNGIALTGYIFMPDHIFLYFLAIHLLIGILTLKKAVIGLIKLYQHYAPERIRRRCLFKPTCSEYAILAVEKYGVVKGLYKAYVRLFKKCSGTIYRIDYP